MDVDWVLLGILGAVLVVLNVVCWRAARWEQMHPPTELGQLPDARAVLAAMGLASWQVDAVCPLMIDYAVRHGIQLPDAAIELGKAWVGQPRAVQARGLPYEPGLSRAENWSRLVVALRESVGGYAAAVGFAGSRHAG